MTRRATLTLGRPLTHNDRASWIEFLWTVIDETNVQETLREEDWDDLCTTMAWLMEDVGVRMDHTGSYINHTEEGPE